MFFSADHRMLLFMFLVQPRAGCRLPFHFNREMAAELLYEMAKGMAVVSSPFRRFRIARAILAMLGSCGLPKRYVPVFLVPAQLWPLKRIIVRNVHRCVAHVPSRQARWWLHERVRVCRGGFRRCASIFNANVRRRGFSLPSAAQIHTESWLNCLRLRSLKKMQGVWRLPMWSSAARVIRCPLRAWRHRVPKM